MCHVFHISRWRHTYLLFVFYHVRLMSELVPVSHGIFPFSVPWVFSPFGFLPTVPDFESWTLATWLRKELCLGRFLFPRTSFIRSIVQSCCFLQGASTKLASVGPFRETKPNLIQGLIGTDTASVELFFNIFTSGIETFIHGRLARWRKWKSCDVQEAKEGLENELWRRWSNGRVGEWAASSFSKPSVTSPTSQLILQLFPRFTYITAHSPTLPLLHLHHCSFSNPSFASCTSQDFHLRHLASRPCLLDTLNYTHLEVYGNSK